MLLSFIKILVVNSKYLKQDVNTVDVVDYLISVSDKSSLDAQDEQGTTALMYCCQHATKFNLEPVVQLLINKGCNLNIQNKLGETALMLMMEDVSKNTVKALIDAGANLDVQNNNKWTALIISVNQLNKLTQKNIENIENIKAVIKLLINAGANVNLETQYGWTVFHLAVETKKPQIDLLEMLINARCSLNKQSIKERWSPVMMACRFSSKSVKFLINAGANIHFESDQGLTAFHIVCGTVNNNKSNTISERKIELLLDAGASINTVSKNGHSPLSELFKLKPSNLINIVKLILKYTPNLSVKNEQLLKSTVPDIYTEFIIEKKLREYIKKTNKLKLIKFIPLRKEQLFCHPNSYRVKMLNYLFEFKQNKDNLTIDVKIKDYFNIHCNEDLEKLIL